MLLCLSGCQTQAIQDVKETRFLLGTIVEFTVAGADEDVALHAIQQAALVMQQVEDRFTTHGEILNTVKTFNQAGADEHVRLEPSVDALLLQAIYYQQHTQGSFDPTLGDLNQRWGFSGDHAPTIPLSAKDVKQSLRRSGTDHLHQVSPLVWVKDIAGLKLDFGAIAKGLAIDEGMKKLQGMGIEHAIINAGGDMRLLGNHMGEAWHIAIRHPRKEEPLGWLDVEQNISIVTSGDYERFFIYEGKRYHHIIDPKTGYASSASISVTVSAPTAAQADALSTAMFILGHEKGMKMVEKIPDVEAIWVDAGQHVYMSSGMKKKFNRGSMHALEH